MAAEPGKTCLREQALTAGNFKSSKIMYAIVDIAGQQFKVEAGSKIFVNRLAAKADESVEFNKVLLIDAEGAVKVGAPYVEGAVVKATVLRDDIKAKKVLVFKKIRRKGFQKLNGHRQKLTQIRIDAIA
jgi:large subunit ribosomal protein L21